MPWQDLVSYSETHDLLAKRLYVVFSDPTDGLQPVLDNLDDHVAHQTELENNGVMFAAGPFASQDEQSWNGDCARRLARMQGRAGRREDRSDGVGREGGLLHADPEERRVLEGEGLRAIDAARLVGPGFLLAPRSGSMTEKPEPRRGRPQHLVHGGRAVGSSRVQCQDARVPEERRRLVSTGGAARHGGVGGSTVAHRVVVGLRTPPRRTHGGRCGWDIDDLEAPCHADDHQARRGRPPVGPELADAPRHPQEPT